MTMAEFWMQRYEIVVAEKRALGKKLRETLEENKELQQQVLELKMQLEAEKEENKKLQNRIDFGKKTNEILLSANMELARKKLELPRELDAQLKQKEEENTSLHNVIDSFVNKCKELEDKVEGYKKKLELLNTVVTPDLDAQLKSMTERLDKSIADRKELQADRDIWFRKNGEKQAEIEELKRKISLLEADLKSKACSRDAWCTEAERLRKEIQESYTDGYSDGNEEGQNELWEMLQLVKDMQPNEFDTECECLGDVIDMDLEDFKEAYDKWEAEQKKAAEKAKKKHVDYMRDYLKRYCIGKLCFNCPLYNASEPVSSCLFSKLTDEEVEKRYKKAVESERSKKITTPISARLPQPWEVTIEGKVEINDDVLKVVCGIKEDKKEET